MTMKTKRTRIKIKKTNASAELPGFDKVIQSEFSPLCATRIIQKTDFRKILHGNPKKIYGYEKYHKNKYSNL